SALTWKREQALTRAHQRREPLLNALNSLGNRLRDSDLPLEYDIQLEELRNEVERQRQALEDMQFVEPDAPVEDPANPSEWLGPERQAQRDRWTRWMQALNARASKLQA